MVMVSIKSLFVLLFTWFAIIAFVEEVQAMTMKRILVTGGNKGIGKAICERLLTEWKDTYVFLGARDVARGQAAVDDIVSQLNCADRISVLPIDTTSDTSVREAARKIAAQGEPLYAIINNAGIGWGYTLQETLNTNYFGPRRVGDAFAKLLQRPGGRIVHVSSASGPNYVESLDSTNDDLKTKLYQPWLFTGGINELDDVAKNMKKAHKDNAYGASKALLNAYTVLQAKMDPDLVINSCTPGFIKTDLTAGTSATNPTNKGAVPPCWLAMDEEWVPRQPTGRYYGSDCVRSPMHFYRGPGEDPFVWDGDENAKVSAEQLRVIYKPKVEPLAMDVATAKAEL